MSIWLDGSDFLNHGIDTRYSITNGNNYIQLAQDIILNNNTFVYYQLDTCARESGILITPTELPNMSSITMCCWGKRNVNNNYMTTFYAGNSNNEFMEARLR